MFLKPYDPVDEILDYILEVGDVLVIMLLDSMESMMLVLGCQESNRVR